ncbi:LOW QUALITY PROTEIN: uncharacterized protein LOC144943881 [Lampetra fluviatilis]
MPVKAPMYLKAPPNKKGKKPRLRDILSPDMISPPLGDFRHLMHIGGSAMDDYNNDSSNQGAADHRVNHQGGNHIHQGLHYNHQQQQQQQQINNLLHQHHQQQQINSLLHQHHHQQQQQPVLKTGRSPGCSASCLDAMRSPVLKNALTLPFTGSPRALDLPYLSPHYAPTEASSPPWPPGGCNSIAVAAPPQSDSSSRGTAPKDGGLRKQQSGGSVGGGDGGSRWSNDGTLCDEQAEEYEDLDVFAEADGDLVVKPWLRPQASISRSLSTMLVNAKLSKLFHHSSKNNVGDGTPGGAGGGDDFGDGAGGAGLAGQKTNSTTRLWNRFSFSRGRDGGGGSSGGGGGSGSRSSTAVKSRSSPVKAMQLYPETSTLGRDRTHEAGKSPFSGGQNQRGRLVEPSSRNKIRIVIIIIIASSGISSIINVTAIVIRNTSNAIIITISSSTTTTTTTISGITISSTTSTSSSSSSSNINVSAITIRNTIIRTIVFPAMWCTTSILCSGTVVSNSRTATSPTAVDFVIVIVVIFCSTAAGEESLSEVALPDCRRVPGRDLPQQTSRSNPTDSEEVVFPNGTSQTQDRLLVSPTRHPHAESRNGVAQFVTVAPVDCAIDQTGVQECFKGATRDEHLQQRANDALDYEDVGENAMQHQPLDHHQQAHHHSHHQNRQSHQHHQQQQEFHQHYHQQQHHHHQQQHQDHDQPSTIRRCPSKDSLDPFHLSGSLLSLGLDLGPSLLVDVLGVMDKPQVPSVGDPTSREAADRNQSSPERDSGVGCSDGDLPHAETPSRQPRLN